VGGGQDRGRPPHRGQRPHGRGGVDLEGRDGDDLFRRHDISGWSKAGWTLFAIVLPFVGVLVYLGTQGEGIAERNAELARAQKARLDEYVRETAGSTGATAEIAKAKELLDSGAISQAEFDRVKQKALS